MPERPQQLAHLEYLGDATKFAGQMHALIMKCARSCTSAAEKFSSSAHFGISA